MKFLLRCKTCQRMTEHVNFVCTECSNGKKVFSWSDGVTIDITPKNDDDTNTNDGDSLLE